MILDNNINKNSNTTKVTRQQFYGMLTGSVVF
jgi:hypothetical protein